jgi:hypothetical protein
MGMEAKIEISIFERELSDCHNKDDLLKLCKEFVNKHDPPKPQLIMPEAGTSINPTTRQMMKVDYPPTLCNYKDPTSFHRRVNVDDLETTKNPNAIMESKKQIIQGLAYDLYTNGYVKMVENRRHDINQWEITASTGAYKL